MSKRVSIQEARMYITGYLKIPKICKLEFLEFLEKTAIVLIFKIFTNRARSTVGDKIVPRSREKVNKVKYEVDSLKQLAIKFPFTLVNLRIGHFHSNRCTTRGREGKQRFEEASRSCRLKGKNNVNVFQLTRLCSSYT